MTPNPKRYEVLLIEDDAGDAELIREAWTQSGASVELRVVDDGRKALAYLHRESPYEGSGRPDLVMLDLAVPINKGIDVLKEMRQDAALQPVPVVIMSSSNDPSDVRQSYGLGANCFIAKPVGLDSFLRIVLRIGEFWFGIARLPAREW
ncbi:MAG: response regulator [Elusimicrobia bacterium]|nr:response regulator [Elusimicrobiota bacterium]